MSHEEEYIDIFEKNRELIESHSSALLNSGRQEAFEKFKETLFPKPTEEDWLHTDIAKRFAADFGMNLGRVTTNVVPTEIFTCDVPNLSTHKAYIVNDTFHTSENKALPNGVILDSLNAIAEKSPSLLAPYYNRLASKGDSIALFNTAFVQDGVLLYIPANTNIEKTIQIVALVKANVDMLSSRRLLIIAGENSKTSLLLCDHSSQDKLSLSTLVTEIFVERGASLDLYEIEETAESNTRIANIYVEQAADSHFNHCNITLTNGFTRNRVEVLLSGKGAECCINGLAIGDKRQHIDNRTLVEHKCSHTASNELYKYILDEESTAVFAGKMLIQPGAQHTTSQQTNRNLCLTSCARMFAQPQLEIYADDVKCSHGSTAGQLDENALFYMQQRGIPADEARHLLMYAFAGEVIENINIDAIRDRLHLLIEKRFRGELNRCKSCNLCK